MMPTRPLATSTRASGRCTTPDRGAFRRSVADVRVPFCRPTDFGEPIKLRGRVGGVSLVAMTNIDPSALTVDIHVRSDGVVAVVVGDVDLATADSMVDQVTTHITGAPAALTVDFAGVRFCDSAGINGLVKLRNRCVEAGWRFRLVNPQDHVRRVLVDLTGLGALLNVDGDNG